MWGRRPECLLRPVVRRLNLRLSRPRLRRALQALERVRDAVVRAPAQAIQQSAPPPGREREVSAVAEHATARVNRRTRDPVVADQPERQGSVESDRVPHASTSRISPSIRNRRHKVQAKNRGRLPPALPVRPARPSCPRTHRTRPGASATPRRPRPGPAPGPPDTRSCSCPFPPLSFPSWSLPS